MNGIKVGSVPRTTSENLFRGGFPVPNSRKAGVGSLANELSVRLWEERRHLESLHSVVEAEQGALRGREIYIELQIAGLARCVVAQSLAEKWIVEGGSTLQQLIRTAHVEPWACIFRLHLEALQGAVGRIEERWAETCLRRDWPTRPENLTNKDNSIDLVMARTDPARLPFGRRVQCGGHRRRRSIYHLNEKRQP
ncbi:hypothetical protein GCM10009825_11960 [Arthrobacter humicola]|uniref:DUF222 domain-containing protein n=1 Tax=Arthrobacter humicola TaxID=409291 RepID=A0ABN2YQC6_9MICC